MRFSFYMGCRLALALALLPTAARAQASEPAAAAPRLPASAGDIPEASRNATEGNITYLLPWILQNQHYSHHTFDAEMSGKFLDRYLDSLDYRHLFFLQSDLSEFEGYRNRLQTLSIHHDFSPSTVIFSRFIERATEQTVYVTNLLHEETFEFTNQERFVPNRHTLTNPASMDEARQLWREELRAEYLDAKLRQGDMAVSGPASIDAAGGVLIFLPLQYTNAALPVTTNSAARGTNRTVASLLPAQLLDPQQRAFGSVTPTESNVIVRLQISTNETRRKITNNFYAPDGQRLGGISFLHPSDPATGTNSPGPAEAGAAHKLKGVVELNRKDPAEIAAQLTKRYTSLLNNYNELTNDDYVLEGYLEALTHAYDPHSDYMGHATTENFDIQMHLSLSGIGAQLKSEDGDCKIEDLIAEGPAAKTGRITNEDIIVAVAQKDQEPVTITGKPLTKVVEMIRGPKGTPVTLTIVKAHPVDPSKSRETVTIVRDVIKLEDKAPKVKFFETPTSSTGEPTRVGLIDLNSFYGEAEPEAPGQPPGEHGSTTTSKDVARLITRMKKENADGIILDLRRNGGGFLDEAIRLTGLFVKGPVAVVQTKSPDQGPDRPGRIEVESTARGPALYDGPLIILTSRFSASASEIVAGALQDYGRALIVGDKATFGKGTVQTVDAMSSIMSGRNIPFAYDPGSLKVTIKKFYRAGGSSTQSNGVASDIVLPSILNYADVGESSLPNPLPWDDVSSADLPDCNMVKPFLAELTKRSLERRQTDKDFAYIQEDIDEYRKTLADKSISLNEAERLAEQNANQTRAEARKKERASRPKSGEKVYEITLKNVDLPGLHEPEVKPKPAAKPAAKPDEDADPVEAAAAAEDPVATDPIVTEARRIMTDYISLLKKPIASARIP